MCDFGAESTNADTTFVAVIIMTCLRLDCSPIQGGEARQQACRRQDQESDSQWNIKGEDDRRQSNQGGALREARDEARQGGRGGGG